MERALVCAQYKRREKSEWRERRAREDEEARLTILRAKYANLKTDEAELERAVSYVTIDTDYKQRARRVGELAALREVLDAFSPDEREYYRRLSGAKAAPRQLSVTESFNRNRIRQLEREIADIYKTEIDGYRYRLSIPATLRELHPFSHAASPESTYKNSLRTRLASALAEVEGRLQEIARLKSEIDNLEGK